MRKNFRQEYETLVANIINEVIALLNENNLNEITLFEGHPYDVDGIKPLFNTFWVCDEQEHLFIQKLIKCNGIWGYVLYNTYDDVTEFPKEFNTRDMTFDCVNDVYNAVYDLLKKRKKNNAKANYILGDAEALEVLKRNLNGE